MMAVMNKIMDISKSVYKSISKKKKPEIESPLRSLSNVNMTKRKDISNSWANSRQGRLQRRP